MLLNQALLQRLFLFALVFVSGSGCARPKYLRSSPIVSEATGSKASCSVVFSNSGLCLSWYWENKPTERQAGQLVFKTYRLSSLDESALEVDLESLPSVILWMPSMGHGSTPTQTLRIDQGTYRARNVFFIMPGEWEIRFQVRKGSDVLDQATVLLDF